MNISAADHDHDERERYERPGNEAEGLPLRVPYGDCAKLDSGDMSSFASAIQAR